MKKRKVEQNRKKVRKENDKRVLNGKKIGKEKMEERTQTNTQLREKKI